MLQAPSSPVPNTVTMRCTVMALGANRRARGAPGVVKQRRTVAMRLMRVNWLVRMHWLAQIAD